MRALGWSVAKAKSFGDETGIWHLLIADDLPHPPRATTACGSRVMLSGQVEQKIRSGHPCQRCAILAKRINFPIT
jgi:hypothetical protein